MQRKYDLDESIFSKIDSHEKAYWVGFISADGCVCGNRLLITLQARDINHLVKFRDFVKSNCKIFERKVKNTISKKHNKSEFLYCCSISISSKLIKNDLYKIGVEERKSLTLNSPKISSEFYNSYILGFIDGDGCFSISDSQMNVCLIGTENICNFVIDTFNCAVGSNKPKLLPHAVTAGMFNISFGGNLQTKRIIDWLYKDSPVFLDRKKDIVESHFSNIQKLKDEKLFCKGCNKSKNDVIIKKGNRFCKDCINKKTENDGMIIMER